jgi:hypothetical protein
MRSPPVQESVGSTPIARTPNIFKRLLAAIDELHMEAYYASSENHTSLSILNCKFVGCVRIRVRLRKVKKAMLSARDNTLLAYATATANTQLKTQYAVHRERVSDAKGSPLTRSRTPTK